MRVTELAQDAQNQGFAGDFAAAQRALSQAFDIIEREGAPNDVCHASVLVVAADFSSAIGETEAGGSLYRRARDMCNGLAPSKSALRAHPDVSALLTRSLLGLARIDVEAGRADRARESYAAALLLLEAMPGCPDELVEEARQGAMA